MKPRTVAEGQLFGIGLLVLANALAGALAVVVPDDYAAFLSAAPLVLGLRKL